MYTTLKDVLDLKEKTGHSTMAVTADGTANGKLLGVITGRDYRISRLSMDTKVETFMTPYDKLICADLGTSLKECNDMIWDNKLNALPVELKIIHDISMDEKQVKDLIH